MPRHEILLSILRRRYIGRAILRVELEEGLYISGRLRDISEEGMHITLGPARVERTTGYILVQLDAVVIRNDGVRAVRLASPLEDALRSFILNGDQEYEQFRTAWDQVL